MKASLGCVARLSLLLVLGCAQSLYADSINNVVTGFSSTSNPNGGGTYNYNGIGFTNSAKYRAPQLTR